MPWRQPRIRVSGMLWHGDKLLLVRQGRPESPRWMLPGGGVEAGESLIDALERELREEVGLSTCHPRRPVALIESIAPRTNQSGRHIVHVVFEVECDDASLDRVRCEDPDVHELRLCPRETLLDIPIHPPIASWLANWNPQQPFAYFGPLWAP